MRILIATDNTRDQINGVVTTYNNIERLAKQDGYDVLFISPEMFSHISAPGYPEVKLSRVKNIDRCIEDAYLDYIHIATEGPIGLAVRNYCLQNDLAFTTSYHTRFPEFLRHIYKVPLFVGYAYLRWFHEPSARILTTTDTMVGDLRQRGFEGDIRAWTRGVDRDHLRSDRTPISKSRETLLYVGRVSKEKNLDDLCDLSNFYDVRIVGDGPYLKTLQQRYPRVKFVGYKSGQDLADEYASANVFVFPSKTDTFGIVMIEAMSLGTPVAGYPVPGPLDVVDEGITGYTNNNLVGAIINASNLDRNIVKQSSEKWSWQNCWNIFKENLVIIR